MAAAENGETRAAEIIEHTRPQNPQFARYLEQNRTRLLDEQPRTHDPDEMYAAAWLEWSHLDPASRAKYYIKAEAPAVPQEFSYPAENDTLDDEVPLEEHDDTPKHFQLQTHVANAGLDLLETSVKRGVKLLDKLKWPLKIRTELSPDAVQWIEQVERLQTSAVKTKTIIGVGSSHVQDFYIFCHIIPLV